MKKFTLLFIFLIISSMGFSQNLVTNGDFQTGVSTPWVGNAANVVDLGGGTFVNRAQVNVAGNPWDANLSQNVVLDNGKTYKLSFDAYTDATTGTRTMIVGLGQNNAPFAALTQTPTLTSTPQTFTYQFTIDYGDGVGDRVLFDMGAATGFVFIDNVSVEEVENTCANGIQDGDETGVDCGGSCQNACPAPPSVAAPTPPVRLEANVISIYSDAYNDIAIDNFDFGLCDGGTPNLATAEVLIAGNPTINYLKPGCQGIDFQTNRQDASTFTNLHFDFYTDEAIVGAVFNIKLVDWAGNPTEAGSTGLEINFNGGTNPALVANQWVSVDVDITAVGGMISGNLTRGDIAQIHITSNLPNAWYDNLYLYKDPGTCSDGIKNQNETGIDCGGPCAPCTGPPSLAAPAPPARPEVISFYSDAYTDIAIDNFDFGLCDGGTPNLATSEVLIAANPTINYLKPGCQGIDFQTNRQNASDFTHLHIDFYTDEADLIGKVFNLKLVDWGGNPTEAGATGLEINFNGGTNPALVANQWVSIDVDITSLGGMIAGNLTRGDLAQIHITSNLSNAWYDNLYLHKNTTLGTKDFEIAGLKVYPNPASDSWTVKTQNIKMSSIQVFDILGKQVLSLKPEATEATINAFQLKSGLYFAKINTAAGSSSLKLVKQ